MPSQVLSETEYDSIKAKTGDQQWKTLKSKLPEIKNPVEDMKQDHKGRLWLKLNYRGDSRKWLIINQNGAFRKIIHLPGGSMLTHISAHHIGVRLDDTTFALFEPVE